MLNSFRRMLVVSASVCVLRQSLLWLLHLLRLVFLCCGQLPLFAVESPPHSCSWDQALSFVTRCLLLVLFSSSCCCNYGVWGCYPRAPCCVARYCCCWSSPGCFQDHCSATMKRFKAATVVCLCCWSCAHFCLLGTGSRPTCWSKMLDGMYNGATDVLGSVDINIYN